jgi:hypothetical protein
VPNTHYSLENFAGTPPPGHTITQTQAIGINNKNVPVIVGFWADQNGLNFGWEDVKGVFTTILDPNATYAGNQNLLGVNDFNKAAGFWTDSGGNEHGFVVDLTSTPLNFTEVPPTLFNGAVATQVSGINDKNQVCGFWADKNGIDHGFFGPLGGTLKSFEVRMENKGVRAKSTQALGTSSSAPMWIRRAQYTASFLMIAISISSTPLVRARLPRSEWRGPSSMVSTTRAISSDSSPTARMSTAS